MDRTCFDRRRVEQGLETFIDRLFQLVSFKTSFTEKMYFVSADYLMNELISDFESHLESNDVAPEAMRLRTKNEYLLALKIFKFACQSSIRYENESISFHDKLSRLNTYLKIEKEFTDFTQSFQESKGTSGKEEPSSTYKCWTFCLHGIIYINEILHNYSKATDWQCWARPCVLNSVS